MSRPNILVVRFRGWLTIRLATEPDPPDEPRGASGYTFAYAGEPPLDRVIRTQPLDEPDLLRPGAPWDWGVFVYDAFQLDIDGAATPLRDLLGLQVKLHGRPKFENRSWLLTPPGWEPIVPFDLAIQANDKDGVLRRSAPLDPASSKPVWQQPIARLLAQGAKDIWPERETVGSATGIWDAKVLLDQRIVTLETLLAEEKDAVKRQCLKSRLFELKRAVEEPPGARLMIRYPVERFSIRMDGMDAKIPDKEDLAGLNPQEAWLVDFWLGAFDFDLLAAFMQGSLVVPFRVI